MYRKNILFTTTMLAFGITILWCPFTELPHAPTAAHTHHHSETTGEYGFENVALHGKHLADLVPLLVSLFVFIAMLSVVLYLTRTLDVYALAVISPATKKKVREPPRTFLWLITQFHAPPKTL